MGKVICNMVEQFLYQTIEALEQAGFLQDMPEFIVQGLSERKMTQGDSSFVQFPKSALEIKCNPLRGKASN